MNKETEIHLANQISQIYEILISLTERLNRLEQVICPKCNEELNDPRIIY